jgi:hypothetical protein
MITEEPRFDRLPDLADDAADVVEDYGEVLAQLCSVDRLVRVGREDIGDWETAYRAIGSPDRPSWSLLGQGQGIIFLWLEKKVQIFFHHSRND